MCSHAGSNVGRLCEDEVVGDPFPIQSTMDCRFTSLVVLADQIVRPTVVGAGASDICWTATSQIAALYSRVHKKVILKCVKLNHQKMKLIAETVR